MTKYKHIILIFAGLILLLIQYTLQASSISQSKFTPEISFIMDGSFVHWNIDNELFDSLEIPGFGKLKPILNQENGFNFNYGELVLSAAVDPYFDVMTVFHLTEHSIEIEEAYATTRRLPLGFKAKLGKFKSGFGRLNEQHAHAWNFADAPLVYRSFFGEDGLQEMGIQLNWLAPTHFYLNFGIESLQGKNEASFGTDGFHELNVKQTPLPNTFTFYGKASIDIGKISLLGGASYVFGKTRLNFLEEEKNPYAFAGKTRIFGLNMTAKYIIDSYRNLAFQMEYLYREMRGTRYNLQEQENIIESIPFEKNQTGLYAQLVYRFHPLWRIGTRWDRLNKNREIGDGVSLFLPGNLNRYSIMIDYSPTEFSRIRVQYNIDRSAYQDGQRKNVQGLSVQLNLAIGAHGAHPF